MRIAICDDDLAFLSSTAALVDEYEASSSVSAFSDGDSLIRAHLSNAFDVILLDIVMPLGNGIEIAREIRTTDANVKIVFLTSSTEFAIESYSVKASNYLLKPLDHHRLFACLNELEEDLMKSARTISVKGARSMHNVRLSSIEYLEGHDKHAFITLTNGQTIETNEPLYAFDDRLHFVDGFFKCHRSYIVNMNHVATYSATEVIMRSGYRIPISRSCRIEFKEAYFSVIFGKEHGET